jgi:TetR/AcrR family transcriptional regulator, transcriptional repressor for nem operon
MIPIMYAVKRELEATMKVSRERVAENREKILQAAGRLFRERGFEPVTVAEVMKGAGLTHGGFYGYFDSKEDLIAAALADALARTTPKINSLPDYAAFYLTPRHRDDCAGGCATAALASETIRQAPEARAVMTSAIRTQIARMSEKSLAKDPARRRQEAIASWAAMVGAMVLARVSDDQELSDEILAQTRGWLEDRGGAE